MKFLNPIFLVGLAGIAVPIVIHLLTRDQVKKTTFSTLRFFANGAKVVVQRRRFQEILLIFLRSLLVALLALAFACPFLAGKPEAAGTVDLARVVLVDVSGSMRRDGIPQAAKEAAGKALQGADSVALVTISETANLVSPFGPPLGDLESIVPGFGSTNLAEGLRRANDLLRGVAARKKEIILISDLEREGWAPGSKLDAGVKLTVLPVEAKPGPIPPTIVQASAPGSLIPDGQPSSIAVRIANYAEQPIEGLDVDLTIDGTKVETQKLNIPAGRSVAARFRHTFEKAGDHPGIVSIGSSEPFYFNARTVPRIPVLLINGRPSADPREDAAFFAAKALAPTEQSPFAVQIVPAAKVSPADIAQANVVVLANVGELGATVTAALSELLNRGGGLLFLPGDQAKAEKFNASFGNTAPFKLRQLLQARPADGETAESLAKIDYEHPIFSVFAAPHHGNLSLPKFGRYWETTDTQRSKVLARFGDGRPAVLEREVGKGISLAWTSAPDASWNNLPFQSVFLPLLHQCVRYLAVQTGEKTEYSAGDALPVPEGSTLKGPDGRDVARQTADTPGFYSLVGSNGAPVMTYAVNAAFSESNPATIAPDELVSTMETREDKGLTLPNGSEAGLASKDTGAGSRFWWFLLCGLIALSITELITANRSVRH